MDPEERKVQGAAIHAVRETINTALTERQAALQQAALAQKLQVKRLILHCRAVVNGLVQFILLLKYKNEFVSSSLKLVLQLQPVQKLKMTITISKH